MSNIAKVAGQAANTLTKPLNVEEVFSTYLYEGNSSTQTINNGIDLTGEGGLTWFKCRNVAVNNVLFDTERGDAERLISNNTSAQSTQATGRYPTFTSTGFTLGADTGGDINYTGRDYASWTFRKAPKFFDVVTYTGDGTNGREIAHNLNAEIGFIAIKRTDAADEWAGAARKSTGVYDVWITDPSYALFQTDAALYEDTGNVLGNNVPSYTDTYFTVGASFTGATNTSGATYVAYLFAHNDGDGDFGPTGDQDIIKCGSYTGNSSNDGPEINLGFEPQWIMIKRASNVSGWYIWDTMRGIVSDGAGDAFLYANASDSEDPSGEFLKVTPTGFKLQNAGLQTNGSSNDYIYIAIRRGPMAVPESATDVFAIDTEGSGPPAYTSNFPVDMALERYVSLIFNNELYSRLTQGKFLKTNAADGESTEATGQFDYQDGWHTSTSTAADRYSWMWKRAPSYFDVVAYKGNNTSGRNVSHNLGVAPEMIWVKARDFSRGWNVYHKDLTPSGGQAPFMELNSTDAVNHDSSRYPSAPTSTDFILGSNEEVNSGNYNYIAYLFATLAGVSKVGSFTYTQGVAQNIDCGFSSGARFVLYKRTSGTSGWTVFDTERGIVAGNDPMLFLNSTAAETSSYDFIDPYSGGFALSDSTANLSGDYIFYAIA